MESTTLSMKIALDQLREIDDYSKVNISDLGFILTVFRDNELDNDMYKLLDILVHKL